MFFGWVAMGAVIVVVVSALACDRFCRTRAGREAERAKRKKARERLKRAQERRTIVFGFPVMKLTLAQYNALPRVADLPKGFEEDCPLGFCFAFAGPNETEDTRVVGRIVESDDLFANQWSTIALPERGCNRYRVVITQAESCQAPSCSA